MTLASVPDVELLALALPRVPVDVAEALPVHARVALLAHALAVDLEWLRRVEAEAPLAVGRLWTHPTAPCDQLRQVLTGLRERFAVALGGNRSGKTYGQFGADVATALGREHPHTQAWCRLNGIDPMLIPSGPGEVVIVAPSAGSSRRDHRRQVGAMLPAGAEWYGMNGLMEAYVRISVPGFRQQATIWFKSADQGAKAFKGGQARLYHLDEEPEGHEGMLVVEECLRGASAVGGRVVITATPQAGMTWMVEKAVMGRWNGAVTTRINSLHNRLAPNYAGLVAWLEKLDPDERAMRERGEWVDRRGAIYPQWSHGLHIVQPFNIPASWPRYRGMDYGQRAPNACVWVALAPDGQLVVYRVRKVATTYHDFAAIIHEAEGAVRTEGGWWTGHTEDIELSWGDPSAPEAIETLGLMDIPVQLAHREVAPGISAVRTALRCRSDGSPGLVVFAPSEATGTGALIDEVVGYRYDPESKAERPVKANDHAADALRYVVRGVELEQGPVADRIGWAVGSGEDDG